MVRGAWSVIRRFFSPKPPLKERVAGAIYRLESQRERLEHIVAKLQRRDREIFERCVGAYLSKDYVRSRMYANECSEVRSVARLLLSVQLALERVILRLETIQEFGDVMVQLTPVLGLVREMRRQISGVVPEVASGLDEVSRLLTDTIGEMRVMDGHKVEEATLDEEARRILDEAALLAEQKVKESFPELPLAETEGQHTVKPVEAEAAISQGPVGSVQVEGTVSPPPPTGDLESLKSRLLEYIRESKGALKLSVCAKQLQASTDDIMRALKALEEEGKIVLNR